MLLATVLLLGACKTLVESNYDDTDFFSLTAQTLASEIRDGKVSSFEATRQYLQRIEEHDRSGARVQAIISINPNALAVAEERDQELAAGRVRGPLHGVPVLVKDNIETRELPTTAGSLALLENNTGRDAYLISKLRDAGAIILGKTNLSEWANFRSSNSISGWSAVGGQTRNPYSLDRTACGSSSGSAAAVAAGFAPIAIGTETNGSIICPAAMNGIVGLKPTVGLVSRRHIVPLAPSQDSAGPMAKSVADIAVMLNVLAGTDPKDAATVEADARLEDYTAALNRDIRNMRIGVFRWAQGDNEAVIAAFDRALETLQAQGVTLVEIKDFAPDPVMWNEGENILLSQFHQSLDAYLATAAPSVTARTLKDLIEFNQQEADRELRLFGQELFLSAVESRSAAGAEHKQVVMDIRQAAGENGIDKLLREHNVSVIAMPSTKPAYPVDVAFTSQPSGAPTGATWLPAMAGYPVLSVPMGTHEGLPLGLMLTGTAWSDALILAVGHAYEKAAKVTLQPSFAESALDVPETAEILRPLP